MKGKIMATDLFMEIFDSHCSGIERVCECGILWFDTYNVSDWEEGELESLLEKSIADPDKYKESGPVGTISINGIEIVWGCSCDLAARYENFIISHASQIAEYLNKKAIMLREQADEIMCVERL